MILFLSWIFLSLIIAFLGVDRKIGYLGGFLACLFMSPLLGIIIIASSKRKSDEAWQKKLLKNSSTLSKPISIADEIEKLSKLRENGAISEDEYINLKTQILNKTN